MTVSGVNLARRVDRTRLVDRLQRLVRTPSENPPGDEAAAGELVRSFCEDLGLEVSSYEAVAGRPNVVARWAVSDGPTVAYCSHIDTVPIGDQSLWSFNPFGATVTDGRLYGRGACDAKGPIAAALEAVAVLHDEAPELGGTLELDFVSDEETMGFKGAGHLVAEGLIRPDIAIVGEPTSLRIVSAQRGACWLRITTRGLAAHGSAPERGVSAIRHMAEIIRHLEETLPSLSHPVLGGPSINVGTIRGGEKVNIVPASCVVEVDRRTIPSESKDDVIASVESAIALARKRHPDIDAMVELSFFAEPFEVSRESRVVQEVVAAVGEATGAPGEIAGFRGASDARFLAEAGAEVVVCGPGDIALAHTVREHIDLDELERAAVAYAVAFANLLAPTE